MPPLELEVRELSAWQQPGQALLLGWPSWHVGFFAGFVSYLLAPKLPPWLASPLLYCNLDEQWGTSQQQQERPKKEPSHNSGRSDIRTGKPKQLMSFFFFCFNLL